MTTGNDKMAPDESERETAFKEGEKGEKDDMAVKLIKIAMSGTKLFHDVDGSGYIAIPKKDEGNKILPITGTDLRSMLSKEYFKKYRRAASEKGLKDAIGVLNGVAMFDMDEIHLHNRVAWRGGDVVYDMSDGKGGEVVITQTDWVIQEGTTPTFKQWNHQSAQKPPAKGGDINDLFKIVNVVDEDRLLTLIHLVSSLLPDIPHPMIVLGGEQGSAKSSASKMFKALIDPSMIDTVAMPRNADRMHQVLSKHWYLMFDNVSWIQDWQSDLFCRAVTGQADVVREYYTTSDDHIVSYKMCLGMNGITALVTSADLLDRTLMIRLNPIADGDRRSEEDINTEFNECRAGILGAMFDVLGKAISIYQGVSLESMPRMADFAKWGCAISEALGYTQEDFLSAYDKKIEAANEDAIESTPVAGLIIRLMEGKQRWEGTAKTLHVALTELVDADGMRARDVNGMKNVKALGNARDRIVPNLRRFGIDWAKLPRSSSGVVYKIDKHPKNGGSIEKISVVTDVSVVTPPLVIPCENNEGNREGITIGAQTTLTSVTTLHSKPLDLPSGFADKMRLTFSKLSAHNPRDDGWRVAEITEAFPQITTQDWIAQILAQHGKVLGFHVTDGRWRP